MVKALLKEYAASFLVERAAIPRIGSLSYIKIRQYVMMRRR